MIAWRTAFALMAKHFLRSVVASRKTLVFAIFWGLAAVVFVAGAAAVGEDIGARLGLYFLFLYTCVGGVALQFTAQAYGLAVSTEEEDTGTAAYLLTRPLPRDAIIGGRLLAGVLFVAATFLVLDLLVTALLLPEQWSSVFAASVPIVLLSATWYVTFFSLLGLFTRHSLLAGLFYVLLWEQPLSMMPIPIKVVSIKFHLMCAIEGMITGPFNQPFPGDEMLEVCDMPASQALLVVAIASVAAAAFCIVRFRRYQPTT